MTVPPFPSQDLAKLVLGYLAEEQLMTAYDEFLQASPYLDALQNEYDRIFMTSLRHIVAEYRAVKIYVETCKPLLLRKKLVQCANLLEIIKCLVNYVDINKIHCQEITEKAGAERQHPKLHVPKTVACDGCNSKDLTKCGCQSKSLVDTARTIPTESTVESSVETTSLSDLPGHLSNNGGGVDSGKISNQNFIEDTQTAGPKVAQNNHVNPQNISIANFMYSVRSNDPPPMIPIEMCPNKQSNAQIGTDDRHTSTAGTFQDFATGIRGPDSGNSGIVPDSSTSENFHISTTKEPVQHARGAKTKIIIRERKAPYLLQVDNPNVYPNQTIPSSIDPNKTSPNKPEEQKITILSDVKVDQTNNNFEGVKSVGMPPVLKNATSTPVLQMQTILINGIPAYRHIPVLPTSSSNFTKDEIMAMPTIIMATSNSVPSSTSQSAMQYKTVKQCAPPNDAFAPLVIDVEENSTLTSRSQPEKNEATKENVTGLVKTVEMKSMPKDSIVTSPGKVNTPHVVPPLRKSSSTPRRSSHIRVLDFTTPRRILQETISENAQEYSEEQVELVLSRSPNLANVNLGPVDGNVTSTNIPEETPQPATIEAPRKDNITIVNKTPINLKKRNWDADLRAVAVSHVQYLPVTKVTSNKKEYSKKKTAAEKKIYKPKTEGSKTKKKVAKQKKASAVVEILDDESDAKTNEKTPCILKTVKPNIKIITSSADKNTSAQASATKKNKSIEEKQDKSTEDCIETPEAERLSLQNVIGAKLNISEFLETPYKQALYDIQMDTPRFLGPDLPGEPMSDIKIMNIPTPKFLNSPNLAQATPSSYSSRPTDYSSGGSYYKPDDQEYIPSAEILGYTSGSTSNKQDSDTSEQTIQDKTKPKSRPVRQCTKNVSYVSRPTNKDTDDVETTSNSSENVNNKKAPETKTPKEVKPLKEVKAKTTKPEPRKRTSTAKKRKTPVKKEPAKCFMKIKPRKSSPLKSPKLKRKLPNSPLKSVSKRNVKIPNKEKCQTPASMASVPTKSRRKSSTPRKLNSTKTFHSESSGHDSLDNEVNSKMRTSREGSQNHGIDSDTDQIALRWSDDGSQDAKSKDHTDNTDDIAKIKEYIENCSTPSTEIEGNLHMDLISRGFDAETAKRIERDLLGSTPDPIPAPIEKQTILNVLLDITEKTTTEKNLESDTSNNLLIVQDEDDEEVEDVELSVTECNEEDDSPNYIGVVHDDSKEPSVKEAMKLKDKFCMEISIEDGVTVRCRATEFTYLFQKGPEDEPNFKETQMAVSSIATNFASLYTPMKDVVRAKCHEIFDSTLTSLDTPLKANSPKAKDHDNTVTEIVLEVEKVMEEKEVQEKVENKKRKRQSNSHSDESANESKKTKPEAQYLLNPANIQNFDIESVLKQLHGS